MRDLQTPNLRQLIPEH